MENIECKPCAEWFSASGHTCPKNWTLGESAESLAKERDALLLQVDAMRDVVDAACAYESILGFDDLNSAYRNRREVTDAFVKAVGAYKTRLPEKPKNEATIPIIPLNCPGCGMTYFSNPVCVKCGWSEKRKCDCGTDSTFKEFHKPKCQDQR